MWTVLLLLATGCPQGDAPNPEVLQDHEVARTASLVVDDDGTAMLTLSIRLAHDGSGPATGSVAPGANLALVDASLVLPSGKRIPAPVVDAADARERYVEFTAALAQGVDKGVKGDVHAALLVSSDGTRPVVEVAHACSVPFVVVETRAHLESVPAPHGGWQFALPRMPQATPLQVRAHKADIRVDGRALHAGQSLDSESAHVVTVVPHEQRMRGASRVIDLENASVSAVSLDQPAALTQAPTGLRFVFVVDESISMGTARVTQAWTLLRAVLAQAPRDARFAVVGYARRPRMIVPPWNDAHAPIAADDHDVDNGSDVVAALELAHRIARDVDAKHEVARVIVLSDSDFPQPTTEPVLMRAVGNETAPLAHLVDVNEGNSLGEWQRVKPSEDPRAQAPANTGGVWVRVAALEAFAKNDLDALAQYLVRPTRIEDPVLVVDDTPLLEGARAQLLDVGDDHADALPLFLPEGVGVRALVLRDSLPHGRASLRGTLWSTPFEVPLPTSTSLSPCAWAATGPMSTAFNDDELRACGERSGAVTRVTSRASVPPWRPQVPSEVGSTGGLGVSTSCCCCEVAARGAIGVGRSGHMGGERTPPEVVLRAFLDDDVAACGSQALDVTVEFSRLEIVDVQAEGPRSACVVERVWSHRLDRAHMVSTDAGALLSHQRIVVHAVAPQAR